MADQMTGAYLPLLASHAHHASPAETGTCPVCEQQIWQGERIARLAASGQWCHVQCAGGED